MPLEFYNQLAPYYHLIFPDWEQSIERQAVVLDQIIQAYAGLPGRSLLDAACGIGTQSLGLHALGYHVAASDLSNEAVKRAQREATDRGYDIEFDVCDMRILFTHWNRTFDVVLTCDNAIPHLLSDEEIKTALYQIFRCTKAGGVALISVRDYESEPPVDGDVKYYGLREIGGVRYVLFQVWDVQDTVYTMNFYVVEDSGARDCKTRVFRTKYYAIGKNKLKALMLASGFAEVHLIEGQYYQPLLVGKKGI